MPTPFESAQLNLKLFELRATSDEPEFCKHLELVVMAKPGVDAVLSRRRNAWLAAARARKSAPVPDAPEA